MNAAYGNAAAAIRMPFFTNADRARMLFGPDVLEFQSKCQQTIVALSVLQARMERGDMSDRTSDAERRYAEQLSEQLASIDAVFLPCLSVAIRNTRRSRLRRLRVFVLGR